MKEDRTPATRKDLTRIGLEALPAIVARAGERAGRRFVEFFTANIRNRNTRLAYAKAIQQFFDWCEARGLRLDTIEPVAVAAYIEQLRAERSAPTVKEHLAAIRMVFDWLVVGQVVPFTWTPSQAPPR